MAKIYTMLMNNGKERKRKFSFFPGKKVIFPFLKEKKTFYFFLSSFWERKDIFLSLLKLKKSFLSLLSFCRFEKIFLSFLFRNEKVIFLSRGKVFFLAHPWFQVLHTFPSWTSYVRLGKYVRLRTT